MICNKRKHRFMAGFQKSQTGKNLNHFMCTIILSERIVLEISTLLLRGNLYTRGWTVKTKTRKQEKGVRERKGPQECQILLNMVTQPS